MVRFPRVLLAGIAVAGVAVVSGVLLLAPHKPRTLFTSVQTSAGSLERVSVQRSFSFLSEQIARTGALTLAVDDVDRASREAMDIARHASGFVFAMQASSDPLRPARADVSLRVPAPSFESTVAALTALGTVKKRSIQAEDLRGTITDADARLRNLRHTEADILKIMDRSGDVDQIMNVENRLSEVRGQIETLESELKDMRARVRYSRIDVQFVARAANTPPEGSAFARIVDSSKAAVHALGDVTITMISAIVWIAVFTPYAAVAVGASYLSWLGLRKYAVRR